MHGDLVHHSSAAECAAPRAIGMRRRAIAISLIPQSVRFRALGRCRRDAVRAGGRSAAAFATLLGGAVLGFVDAAKADWRMR